MRSKKFLENSNKAARVGLSVRIKTEIHARLCEYAYAKGISLNTAIETALELFLEKATTEIAGESGIENKKPPDGELDV